MVSANRVDASGQEGARCGSHCSFGEKHSAIEEILTGVIARHARTLTWAKWQKGKGKKAQYLINKQIIQNTTTVDGKS